MDLIKNYDRAFFFGYSGTKSDFYLDNLDIKEKIILETDGFIISIINERYPDIKVVQNFDDVIIDEKTLIIINDTFHIIMNSTTNEEKQDIYNFTKNAGGFIIEDMLKPSEYINDSELIDLPVDEDDWKQYLEDTKFYDKYNMIDVSCDYLAKTYKFIDREEPMGSFYYSTPWVKIRDQLAKEGYKLVYHCDYTDEKIMNTMKIEYNYDVNFPTHRESYFVKF